MGQNTELQQGMNRDVVAPRIAREIILAEFNENWNAVVHSREFHFLYWHDTDHDCQ